LWHLHPLPHNGQRSLHNALTGSGGRVVASSERVRFHRLIVVFADMRHRVLASVAPIRIHRNVHHLFAAEEVEQLLVIQLDELE
jgi:hypothetical protein